MKWVCCQLGARMHYAVPRLLCSAGRLERFYTDIYAGWAGSQTLLALIPKAFRLAGIRRLQGRASTGLPGQLVKSYLLFGLAYYFRRRSARTLEEADRVHLWAGKVFGEKVVRSGFGKADCVYAFNTAALEILAAARRRGMFTVMEQTIVPRSMEESLLAEAHALYPGWEVDNRSQRGGALALADRERREWEQADLIVCGSDFVRDGIRRCGGPVERCVVIPYGVDSHFTPSLREGTGGTLRVLTVGQVGLRKGAGCASKVASLLKGVAQFRWVGSMALLETARKEMASHIELTGAVPRNDIMRHYAWADVFFLPSICEGSATVTYEALTCGLPVVTTPNAGSPVRDGTDGFIVPVNDVSAMAERLRQLHDDRNLLIRLGRAATLHSEELSLAAYQKRFLHLVLPHSLGRDNRRFFDSNTPENV